MIEDFFRVVSRRDGEGGEVVFAVSLNPDCDIYRGHFPNRSVAPGVCSIEMILSCASVVAGRPLRIASIRKCRFITLITPDGTPELEVSLKLTGAENVLTCYGSIRREGTDYVKIVMDLIDG